MAPAIADRAEDPVDPGVTVQHSGIRCSWCIMLSAFGAFHKWGYPQIIHISMGFSLINHPFGGTPIYGNPHLLNMYWYLKKFKHTMTLWLRYWRIGEESIVSKWFVDPVQIVTSWKAYKDIRMKTCFRFGQLIWLFSASMPSFFCICMRNMNRSGWHSTTRGNCSCSSCRFCS